MANLEVEIVAADHAVWSGAATLVKGFTSEGEIGILARSLPVARGFGAGLAGDRTCGRQPLLG